MKKLLLLVILFSNFLLLIIFPAKLYSQNVAIEVQKMNILYKFVPNPINVVIENCPCNKVAIKSNYGSLTIMQDSCHYRYNTSNCETHLETIIVGINEGKEISWIDTVNYQVHDIFKYIESDLSCIRSNLIKKEDLLSCIKDAKELEMLAYDEVYELGLKAPLINFDINLSFPIIKYSVDVYRVDSLIYSEVDIKGTNYSSGIISQFKTSQLNDKYIFYNVTIEYGDCEKIIKDKTIIIK